MLQLEAGRITLGDFSLSAAFTLTPGERLGVVGASGSGKSTLLGALSGVIPLAAGQLRWDGQDITELAPAKRPLGILFQDGNLFPHLPIAGTLALALNPKGRIDAAGRARIDEVLDRVDLSGLGTRRPAELSGGQQARAALARVLFQDPKVLLLDEPFGALGPALKADMLTLVSELATERGTALMMVSHDPEDVRGLCPRCLWIAGGALHGPQDTAQLLDHPPQALTAYLGP